MQYRTLFCSFFIVLMLTGCASFLSKTEPITEDSSCITIGNILEVKNPDSRLILLDHKETLAAEGLYYLSFGITDQNNKEEELQSYPAQLYLLAGEAKNNEEAQYNMDTWLSASKENYQILEEKEISCKEQTYFILSYSRSNVDSTYTKGISAFSTINQIAICIELISTENFSEDLETTITNFLNNCSYFTD